ncbi:unnamed protein product, partial [Cladocopium goreaui]
VTLLVLALQAVGAAWLIEQPISSLAWYQPRLRSILRSIHKVYVCKWWMGHYRSATAKRHICWSNTRKVGALDRGTLTKSQREEIRKSGVKSATTKVNRKGKKSYTGTQFLRGTGAYPPHFGLKMVRLFPRLTQYRTPPPEVPEELVAIPTQEFFDSLPWDEDKWEVQSQLWPPTGQVFVEYEAQLAALKKQKEDQATDAELKAARRGKPSSSTPSTSVAPKATARASGKSKAKPAKPVIPPENSPKEVTKTPVADLKKSRSDQKKVIKKPKSKSVPKPSVPSAASQPPVKRHRGKSPAAPPHASEESEIEQLKKANAKLTADLEALLKKDSSGPATPAPRVSAPSPKTPASSKPNVKAAQAVASQEDGSEEEEGEETENEEGSEESEQEENEEVPGTEVSSEPTEAAKNNRLRRLCEKKPSGRMQVPQEIHDIWAKGGPERLALRDQLEGCGWQKDQFVSTVLKIKEKSNKFVRTKKRGWYTKEKMRIKLGWSKSYINDVVKYCEKKGNEALRKRDTYNKNLWKYLVEVDEDDEEQEEDLEKETKSSAANGVVKFSHLDRKRSRKDIQAEAGAEESEEADDDDKDAECAQGAQEFQSLKKFGDSLLSRSGKLADLSGQLDDAMAESESGSYHRARVQKSQRGLEEAIKILEDEFDKVESTKADVSDLQNRKLPEADQKLLVSKAEAQIKSSTRACSKVTTAESTAKNFGIMKQYEVYIWFL